MKKSLQKKIQHAGKLLAQSMLDAEIKKAILKNAHLLSEKDIDMLIDSLQKETGALADLERSAGRFEKETAAEWKKVALLQREAAKSWAEETNQALAKGD